MSQMWKFDTEFISQEMYILKHIYTFMLMCICVHMYVYLKVS